ncbi:ribonuclease R [Mycoplasmopsis gallopavonis]|uniref:Ribonuclease R n=1 Tax=Mycoplasmopsis gallopavonis TaxID=76629 RepID=A0A449B0M9_9BACT|nr:ribonuclease R [Mycoplasmopsis gallopavonis]RIV17001.1 ribonuclease R [Mycoplasmopsis gallopavonis]VEU73294.1 VACB-like ribonuclease II [Mycoplasmopsis gallopavonis]
MNQEKIYQYIQSAESRSFLDIAKHFRISVRNNKDLTNILSILLKEYKIFKNNKDEYYAPILQETIQGVLSVSQKGSFGFVDYDIDEEAKTKKSVFIKNFNFNGAMHGDTVEVNVYVNPKSKQQDLTHGVITKILERGNEEVIGFIKQKNTTTYFVPVDERYKWMQYKIVSSLVQTKLNDLVVAKIIKYEDRNIFIQIAKVITNEADPMVFVKSYLEQIKAPSGFPTTLEEEIKSIPSTIANEDWTNRVDLRDQMIVTIDGDDTKDFDDAITVRKLANGNFFLGVYIADVSYYVRENTKINEEALNRGTSIYLVDRVIPMLPEELSNGICSLNPNEDRFVLACEMEINPQGETLKTKLFQGIINSQFRLTYKQVDKYFETNLINEDYHDQEKVSKLKSMLNQAKELSLILHEYKIKQGYVDFEIDEPKIKLNQDGTVREIIINKRGFSEVLIEDFMVRANETVAKYLYDHKLPVLYRVHEKPDGDKLVNLRNALSVVNISMGDLNENNINPHNFSDLVESVKRQRSDDFVKLLFLRTMQKAIYSPDNIKHFGLASDYYCHFTSPIRRYPDLVIHRVIRNFIINNQTDQLQDFKDQLATFGDLNTRSEQKAVQIERNVNDLKFAEFLKNQIGKQFKAQILSILNFGFFVEFEFKASGLVHRTNLFDGEYEANETLTKLVSPKRTFTLGDYVDVVVVGVDLVEGKVDCVLADLYPQYLENQTKNQNSKQSGKNEHKKRDRIRK